LLLETLTDHLKQEGGFVMFEGTLRQPGDDWLMVIGLNPAKPEMMQHGIEVGTTGHATLAIVLQGTGSTCSWLARKVVTSLDAVWRSAGQKPR
jgi:hypothetical protein